VLLEVLEKAPIRSKIAIQAFRSGRAMPEALRGVPPTVNEGLQLFMQAFWDLCSDRTSTGRISWIAIELWGQAHAFDRNDCHQLHFLVSRLDTAYIRWAEKKKPKKPDDPQGVRNQPRQGIG
jgi:hypothetical protein